MRMWTTLCIPLISKPTSVLSVCPKKFSNPVMKKPMMPISR
jgi:hypothetical protein